jgi:hypothetical protein
MYRRQLSSSTLSSPDGIDSKSQNEGRSGAEGSGMLPLY